MAGDDWQKFANLRLLYGYMYTQPGRKLLFMGGELAQWREWNHETSLDWHLLERDPHRGVMRWLRDLNTFYRAEKALHALDDDWRGFSWVDCNAADQSVLVEGDAFFGFLARGAIEPWLPQLPRRRRTRRRLDRGPERRCTSTAEVGSGTSVACAPPVSAGQVQSLNLTLPPLAMVVFRPERSEDRSSRLVSPVECASCGRSSRPGARFCGGCGRPLARRCSACGRRRGRRAVLRRLRHAARRSSRRRGRRAEGGQHRLRRPRRSTALHERLDPESARLFMERHYRAMHGAVAACTAVS
jgi:hypothetical protein